MPDKTVHYLQLFARKAAGDYSHAEAATALEEALVHAENLPAAERDRRVAELTLALAESQLPLARFPDTLEVLSGSAERIESLDDQALHARYHFWLAHTYSYMGRQDEASAHGSRSAELARACGDEAIEGKACYVLGRDAFWSGRFKEGLEHSLRAIVLLERSGEPWWQGQAHWVAGFHHHALGQLDQGLTAMANARTIGEALDDPRLDTSWSIGYFLASAGSWEQGIEECRGGVERARDPLNTAAATGFLGYAYLEMRDRDRAIATLEDAVGRLEGTGMQQLHGWFLAHLAEAFLLAGRHYDAVEAARRAIEITTQARFWFGVGLAERALGKAELAAQRIEPAAEHLEAACDRFEQLGAPLEVARAHLEMAALAHAAGTGEVARHLAEAHRSFRELGASRYVVRVLEAAGELGVPVDLLEQPAAG
jgi:tetratricopeptide (TPR) repeat protein